MEEESTLKIRHTSAHGTKNTTCVCGHHPRFESVTDTLPDSGDIRKEESTSITVSSRLAQLVRIAPPKATFRRCSRAPLDPLRCPPSQGLTNGFSFPLSFPLALSSLCLSLIFHSPCLLLSHMLLAARPQTPAPGKPYLVSSAYSEQEWPRTFAVEAVAEGSDSLGGGLETSRREGDRAREQESKRRDARGYMDDGYP